MAFAELTPPCGRGRFRAFPQCVEVVGPPLHHLDALGPVRAPVVGAAHGVAVAMRKGAFDGVRVPLSGLVQGASKPWLGSRARSFRRPL